MDAKSQAKSKRAHSQHLNKKHQTNPKAKAAVVAAARAEGNASKPSGQKSRQVDRLPSNWDRYEEEFDVGSEDRSLNSTIAASASDVVVPKSKGADFSYLVSEARTQSSSNVEYFTSFEDTLPEFDQAISSMLSVRREGILLWTGDDNFIIDDNGSAGCEASFLSMDLHALAEQLEKLDVSQRLFIEEDLLPPELCAGGNNTVRHESEQPEMVASGNNSKDISDESAFHSLNDVDKIIDLEIENMSGTATNNYDSFQRPPRQGVEFVDLDTLSTTNSNSSVPTFTSQSTGLMNPVLKDNSKQLDDTALRGIVDSMQPLKDIPIEDSAEKTLKFEALAAEAELDMLLNSFGESNLLDSSSSISKHPTSSFPLTPKENSNSFLGGFTAATTVSIKTVPMKVNLNDTIDDLLGETLDSKNQKNEHVLQAGTSISSGLPSLSVSSNPGPKVLDDFESWYRGRGLFLDPPTAFIRSGTWSLSLPKILQSEKLKSEETTFSSREEMFYGIRDISDLARSYLTYISKQLSVFSGAGELIHIGALIIEPVIHGAGGMHMVDPLFQRILVKECQSRKIPVIFDEVFTGFWRLGVESAAELLGCLPDIACFAKLMSGGVIPLAATLATDAVFNAFKGDSKLMALLHGHSYSAHAMGCTAAVKAIQWFKDPLTNHNITAEGKQLRELWDMELVNQISLHPSVKRVVVLGTLFSLELQAQGNDAGYRSLYAKPLLQKLNEDGIYMRPLGNVIYLMCGPCTPPHICSQLLNKLDQRLQEFNQSKSEEDSSCQV